MIKQLMLMNRIKNEQYYIYKLIYHKSLIENKLFFVIE